MQKILQLDILNWANSCTNIPTLKYRIHLIIKLIADVQTYDTRQTKTQQFALPKARSNSAAEMIKFRAIEIWSKTRLEIKIYRVWHFFQRTIKKRVLLGY